MRPTPTSEPTRPPAPTFTPTPESLQGLVVVTPPSAGTPGVIVIPPGVDPSTLIPVPTATSTPTPAPTSTPADTPTPTPTPISVEVPDTPDEHPPVSETEEPLLPTPTVDRSRVVVLVPGATPAAPAAPPTETPTPAPTPTPTASPTPFVLVESGLVSLRSGPGVTYPLVAQLGPNIPIAVTGRTPEGTWLQICCVNSQSLWVAAAHVRIQNDLTAVSLELPGEDPPPPTATATPTDTPTVTPTPTATSYPFQIADGPQFFPTNNPFLSVWIQVMVGSRESPHPLPGYFVRAEFRASPEGSAWDSRPNTRGDTPSTDFFEFSAPAGPAGGNRVRYNLKYEFMLPDPRKADPSASDDRLAQINGFWRLYLTDGSGTQLTDYLEFDTMSGNPNREVYVAWTPQ